MKSNSRARALAQRAVPDRMYRNFRNLRMSFFLRSSPLGTMREKMDFVDHLYFIHKNIDCPHKQEEVLQFINEIGKIPKHMHGVVVEAGCYKGGSTAKFSLACKHQSRKLVVFDSFQGIPANSEQHGKNIYGKSTKFDAGEYCGTLDEVRQNVAAYGDVDRCEFIKGWFDTTLPEFKEPVCAAYIDVDLQSSTKTCLKYLYPLVEPGGVILSQDGHLPLVIEAFDDGEFWEQEVGVPKPKVHGLGKSKILRILKE